MNNRWFSTPRELKHVASRLSESGDTPEAPLPLRKEEAFWRSWLATGVRRVPIDRRRARGAEPHLKKILVGGPSGAVDFPSAMARQAIDEALHDLPPQHKQVVKLAYFGGLTNREIAEQQGLTVSEVRRVLRASLAWVGAYVERGRDRGRRAIQDLAMLPLWRVLGGGAHRTPWPSLDHVLQTGIVAAMTVAAAFLVIHQAPAHVVHTHRAPHAAAVGAAGSNFVHSHQAVVVEAGNPTPGLVPVADAPAGLGSLPAVGTKAAPPALLPVSVTAPAATVPSIVPIPRVPAVPQLPFGA